MNLLIMNIIFKLILNLFCFVMSSSYVMEMLDLYIRTNENNIMMEISFFGNAT